MEVERTAELGAAPHEVWELISDPAERAGAISFVKDYEVRNDEATWHVELPIPLLRPRIDLETRDVEKDPLRYVKLIGRSRLLELTGEHWLEPIEGGTRLTVRVRAEAGAPLVEKFMRKKLEDEVDDLLDTLRRRLDK